MSDFLSHPVPAVVLLLGLLVFVHELGHFWIGRLSGIAVEVFSIGFGPRIAGFTRRGTQFQIGLIPLGGFVKFAGATRGEAVPSHLEGCAFVDAPLRHRMATVIAGPAANFLLAIVAFGVLGFHGIPHPPPTIGEVLKGSRAEAAGIKPGDRFLAIGDQPIKTWRDLEKIIAGSPEKPLQVKVTRAREELTLTLTPAAVEAPNLFGRTTTTGRAGIALGALPPIVRVVGTESPAARAGLKTGDRVLGAKLTSDPEAPWIEVSTFAALTQVLTEGLTQSSPPPALILRIRPWQPEGDAQGGPSGSNPDDEIRTITLAEGATPPAPLTGTLTETGTVTGNATEALATLGLADAQLVVGDFPRDEDQSGPNTAASSLKVGDLLVSVGSSPVSDLYSLREALLQNQKPIIPVEVIREGERQVIQVTLAAVEAQKPEGVTTVYYLPVGFMGAPMEPTPTIESYKNPLHALWYGVAETARQTGELSRNVFQLMTGHIPLKSLGGPMLIAKVAGDSARRGWQTFLGSLALISINLGLLNLFPIPVLDGGQLVMMGLEGARRRPLGESAQENFQKIGFAMIMALVILATYNDLSRFWKSMLSSVVGLFD